MVRVLVMVCGIVLVAAVSGCVRNTGSSTDPAAPASARPAFSANTRCGAWLHKLSSSDRLEASRLMLHALNAYDQSGRFVREFAKDVSKACRGSSVIKVSEVAAGLATLDHRDFP